MNERDQIERLVQQQVEFAEREVVRAARATLARVLTTGQDERDYSPDKAVYAAARAFCSTSS